jgi:type IV pilus assembly protein PilW
MRRRPPSPGAAQAGLSLVELMVSLALGLLVVLAASALLLQARAAYLDIDDAARVRETGRLALAHLADALRQAGHLPREAAPTADWPSGAVLLGDDDSSDPGALDAAAGSLRASAARGLHGSDILMVGYFGAPSSSGAAIANCSGGAVDDAPLQSDTRSWSIYYIAPGIGDEPELRCRYRGKSGAWATGAIARGVEAMQLRHGLDSDLDGHADRWLDASAIGAADWPRVRLARIALLVRGEQRRPAPAGIAPRSYRLFDEPAGDRAWTYTEQGGEQRLRAVFRTTVFLRNAGGPP